jgi:hypothetical protein
MLPILKISTKRSHFESPENNQSNAMTGLKGILENDFHPRHG